MDGQIHAPSMTKNELVAHIETWHKRMSDDLRMMSGKSLLDAQVVGATIQGLIDDVSHIYLIVCEVARRLPD